VASGNRYAASEAANVAAALRTFAKVASGLVFSLIIPSITGHRLFGWRSVYREE
jgi:hypothetical protein